MSNEMSESLKNLRKANVRRKCKGKMCKNKVLIGDLYCKECKEGAKAEGKNVGRGSTDRHKVYNKFKRDKRSREFYESYPWRKLAKKVKRKQGYWCQVCLRKGYWRKGRIAHHKVEIKDNWDLRMEETNIETVCDSCHSKIHGRGLF